MGLTTTQKVVLVFVVFIILFIGWGLFPLFFKWLMIGIGSGSEKTNLEDFGPMGDIYGSLNTLFTSSTLIIVMYSAYLQRQANEDTRKALADQLAQAKESTQKQLALAKSAHKAQIQESRISLFTSQFYTLLNYKNEIFKELSFCDASENYIKGHKLFSRLHKELHQLIIVDKFKNIDSLDETLIRDAFDKSCKKLNNDEKYYELFVYLEIYSALIDLINSSTISKNDKNFYLSLMRRSMTLNEQLCIFLLAPMWPRVYTRVKVTPFFNTFGPTIPHTQFALKFYQKNSFALQSWEEQFENEENRNPA